MFSYFFSWYIFIWKRLTTHFGVPTRQLSTTEKRLWINSDETFQQMKCTSKTWRLWLNSPFVWIKLQRHLLFWSPRLLTLPNVCTLEPFVFRNVVENSVLSLSFRSCGVFNKSTAQVEYRPSKSWARETFLTNKNTRIYIKARILLHLFSKKFDRTLL